jgi:predicted glycosyl hydrolase (DUF1957 family)
MSERRARSDKQKVNDALCATRMKAYHAELKKLKEARILENMKQEFKNAKPLKIKGKAKSVKELIENIESESITPLKSIYDELDIPIRTKRPYHRKFKLTDKSEIYLQV